EADERSRATGRGAGGAKGGGRGECEPAKRVPDTAPGRRVTGAGAHTASRNASPSITRGGSRMRESRPYGSVRGALSNERPYRDFAWFYSSESGLIKGLERFPNKNFFSPRPSPDRPCAPSFSDFWDDVGRLPVVAREESKNCGISLIRLGLPAAASALARAGRQTKSRHITGREHLH